MCVFIIDFIDVNCSDEFKLVNVIHLFTKTEMLGPEIFSSI